MTDRKRKQREDDAEEQLSPSKWTLFLTLIDRRRATGAEELEETISASLESHDLKVLRLRIASLFFDTIPTYLQ